MGRPIGFYTDEEGRKRPITPGSRERELAVPDIKKLQAQVTPEKPKTAEEEFREAYKKYVKMMGKAHRELEETKQLIRRIREDSPDDPETEAQIKKLHEKAWKDYAETKRIATEMLNKAIERYNETRA